MKDKKKVAVYMRCSTNTIERYKEMYVRLTGFVKAQTDYELTEIYYDYAPGNWSQYPENLKRLLDDCGSGRFDAIVIEKLSTFSAYSRTRTDIADLIKQKGIRIITLHTAQKEQRRAERARSVLQYEMIEDALERGVCLTKEQYEKKSKEKAAEFIEYIEDNFAEILNAEPGAPYKKVIGIHVGDKVCCIPLTARSLLALRDSMVALRRSID